MRLQADSEGSPGWLAHASFAPGDFPSVTPSVAVTRALEWVQVGLLYCQSPNGGTDARGLCVRQSDPDWDPYRSDCSGLVSWAWGLPAPGITTAMLPPNDDTFAFEIDASDLRPGDALNKPGHVMLFDSFQGDRIRVIEEFDFRQPAAVRSHQVAIEDGRVRRGDTIFFPIRYRGMRPGPARRRSRLPRLLFGAGLVALAGVAAWGAGR